MKRIPPPSGGAVQDVPEAPREQVVKMLAPEPEKDFEESLPESTAGNPVESPIKRKRRSKAEIEAARATEGGGAPAPVTDARAERAKSKFSSLGASSAIKAGFSAAKKPLEKSEVEDVEDYFYLVGTKGGLDPTQSWFTMFLCALLLIARLIFVRTDLGENLKGFLFPEDNKKKESAGAEENGERKPTA